MKAVYNLVCILSVFTNTNYAVDAIVLMASKGIVPSYLIAEISVLQRPSRPSRSSSVPMQRGLRDASLGTMEDMRVMGELVVKDYFSEIDCHEGGAPLASKPIPIVLAEQGKISDDEEEVFAPHSLPKDRRASHRWGASKASLLVGPFTEVFMEVESDTATPDEGGYLSESEVAVQEQKDEELERVFSPLSLDARHEGRSLGDVDDDDFFSSGEFHRVSVLTVEIASESPLWIPGKEITVTFTRTNTKETVMWGGRVEQQKTVSGLVRINPTRCQTPMTPVNQVERRSVITPGSRTLDSRLREASIGALFPIRIEVNPVTGEDIIKAVPSSEPPIITPISEIET